MEHEGKSSEGEGFLWLRLVLAKLGWGSERALPVKEPPFPNTWSPSYFLLIKNNKYLSFFIILFNFL